MTELRAGLIGMGAMGRHHARVLREIDGVELTGVLDLQARPTILVDETRFVASLGELLDRGVDYCVVATPTESHRDLCVRLAEMGIPFLVEKPLASSVSAGREIRDAVLGAGIVAGVGHIERFNVAITEMRSRLERGQLGVVHQIATRRQGPFPRRIKDIGVIGDLATHDLDLAAWVTQSKYESVFARTAYKTGRDHEDLVAITGRLSNGVISSHLVNWLSPFKERTTVATGELGAFMADTLSATLTFVENSAGPSSWEMVGHFTGVGEGNSMRYALDRREPLRVEHEDFRNSVVAGTSPGVPVDEALDVLRVAEAVHASAEEERVVLLDYSE